LLEQLTAHYTFQEIEAKENAYIISKRSKNAKERSTILYNIAKLYEECKRK